MSRSFSPADNIAVALLPNGRTSQNSMVVLSRSMRPFLPLSLLLCSVILLSLSLTAKGSVRLEQGNVSDRIVENAVIPNGNHNANFGNGTDFLLPWYKDFLALPSNGNFTCSMFVCA
jgi:hypothetical protein